jgi:hypothetical protein
MKKGNQGSVSRCRRINSENLYQKIQLWDFPRSSLLYQPMNVPGYHKPIISKWLFAGKYVHRKEADRRIASLSGEGFL